MVQRYVLDKISDPRLKAYVVWGPFKERETEADARLATPFVPDLRATHFWTEALAAGEVFRGALAALGLGELSAWDSFLLYPAETLWEESPPPPAGFMNREVEGKAMNGSRLFEQTRALLNQASASLPPPRGSPEVPPK